MRLTAIRVTEPSAQQLTDLEKIYKSQQLTQQQLATRLQSLPDGTTAWTARFNDREQAAALLSISQTGATVSAFTVRDFNRRRGIGSFLLAELMRFAARQGTVRIRWDIADAPAAEHPGVIAFLHSQGFVQASESGTLFHKELA